MPEDGGVLPLEEADEYVGRFVDYVGQEKSEQKEDQEGHESHFYKAEEAPISGGRWQIGLPFFVIDLDMPDRRA